MRKTVQRELSPHSRCYCFWGPLATVEACSPGNKTSTANHYARQKPMFMNFGTGLLMKGRVELHCLAGQCDTYS